MKTGKFTTLVLAIGVLLVWGDVIARVIAWNRPDDDKAAIPAMPPDPGPVGRTDTLVLNYRDPFLGSDGKKPSQQPGKESAPVPAPPQGSTEPTFVYKGMMRSGGRSFALVDVKGQVLMLKKGESVEGFRITDIGNDVLVVRKNGTGYNVEAR